MARVLRRAALLVGAFAMLPAAAPAIAQASKAPAFTVQLYPGGEVASSKLAGRIIILTFWASWCAPCKRELAELDAVVVRRGAARIAAFAIDAGTNTEPRLLARQAATLTMPVATAITGPYRPRNNVVPTTYVIDQQGFMVLTKSGAFKPGEIGRLVDALLAAPTATGTGR